MFNVLSYKRGNGLKIFIKLYFEYFVHWTLEV